MEFLTKILAVAAGGALGAVARYLINISSLAGWLKPFPFPTFLINVSGSFVIGFLMIIFTERLPDSENLRLALMVGFLGAFTTFSTFELEIWALIRDGFYMTAFGYLLLSIVAGFIGVVAGVAIGKQV